MISKALQHFRTEHTDDGVVTVWIDVAGRSVNVFDSSVIEELEFVIQKIRSESVSAVIFRSAKPSGFFAGADVRRIAELRSRKEVEEVITRGQCLFSDIEHLGCATIAAIHGPCLGGGLEFALACQYRLALDSGSTRLGLPEIQLGLIPGWGGTQRLPKLIGPVHALPMILQGKKLSADRAFRTGLVDAVCSPESWDTFPVAFARESVAGSLPSGIDSQFCEPTALAGGDGRSNHCDHSQEQTHSPSEKSAPAVMNRSFGQRLWRAFTWSAPGRWLILRTAEKKVRQEAKNYPALAAAIRAVRAAFDKRCDGFAVERAEFAQLLETPTCRNLLNLFFWRERARSIGTMSDDESLTPSSGLRCDNADGTETQQRELNLLNAAEASTPVVHRIAVIGAGAMGAGIGQLAALKGYHVVLKELTPVLATAGLNRVTGLLDEMVGRRQLSRQERDDILSRISVTDRPEALAGCDLVIEAVVEKMSVKANLFAELDEVLKPEAIIVSNTSALSVKEMGQATRRPDRVAGLHFFNPVHRMDLVEVVRTEGTSHNTMSALLTLVRKLGKTPVVTTDSPGFLVNRVLFPYIGEAVRMLLEGYDCQQLDRDIRRFGMPMGPVELVDHVGLDVAWHVAATLEDILPESHDVISLLGQMVARGWTGRKSGRGFYVYHNGKPKAAADLTAVIGTLSRDRQPGQGKQERTEPDVGVFLPDGLTEIQRRVIYPMINEVGFCLQEGVISEPWMADLAMILGTGFAPFRGGPMTLAESIGTETLLNNLHVLGARYGERFKPSAWLADKRCKLPSGDRCEDQPAGTEDSTKAIS